MAALKKTHLLILRLILALLAVLTFAWGTLYPAILRNRLALSAAQQALAGGPVPDSSQFSELAKDCRANWLLGYFENERSQMVTLNQSWRRAIACDSKYMAWIYRLNQDHLDLAQQVNRAYPQSSVGWFWLAALAMPQEPAQAITYYRKGLEYAPQAGEQWLALGILLRQAQDYSAAMEAFYQACIHGDPGYNGCLYAGNMAELLGDDQAAIRYYRRSLWMQARARADALEQKLPGK